MYNFLNFVIGLIFLLFVNHFVKGQEAGDGLKDSVYTFRKIIENQATSVKDQAESGTCWDFATVSFLESELFRMGKGELDLSEMFFVRNVYPVKAQKYIRYHGKSNFTMGGQAHDVTEVIKLNGMVLEEAYPGLMAGEDIHNHGELDALLKAFCDVIVRKRNGIISEVWPEAYAAVLDAYLGKVPEVFAYDGSDYSPVTFAEYLEIDADDYIELTSWSDEPYYEKIILEVPDNWSNAYYYNLPLDELIYTMEYVLRNGYTIVWDGDVSDRNFSFKNGVAIVPEKDWEEKTEQEKEETFKVPGPQKQIDQHARQKAFDNQSSTDDHLMHLTGLYTDRYGVLYFNTKNSWGEKGNAYGGYIKMSEPYVRLKTIAIMVNKHSLPPALIEKLEIN